jgi:hypothetical protein
MERAVGELRECSQIITAHQGALTAIYAQACTLATAPLARTPTGEILVPAD